MKGKLWIASGCASLLITGCGLFVAPAVKQKPRPPITLARLFMINPPATAHTAEATALGSVRWMLSNKRHERPRRGDVRFVMSVANNSIVALRVPGTTVPWYEYVLLRRNTSQWQMKGVMDVPWKAPYSKNARGLKIPFRQFLSASQPLSNGSSYWVVENQHQAITLVRQPRTPITLAGFHHVPGTSIYELPETTTLSDPQFFPYHPLRRLFPRGF